MPKNVHINCAHCGASQVSVEDTNAIPGVPDSYVSAGERAHADSAGHAAELMKKDVINKGLRDLGMKPAEIPESVQGRLGDFTHGKDHNA